MSPHKLGLYIVNHKCDVFFCPQISDSNGQILPGSHAKVSAWYLFHSLIHNSQICWVWVMKLEMFYGFSPLGNTVVKWDRKSQRKQVFLFQVMTCGISRGNPVVAMSTLKSVVSLLPSKWELLCYDLTGSSLPVGSGRT